MVQDGGRENHLSFSNLRVSLEFSDVNPPRNLKVEAQTNTSISLSWNTPAGTDTQILTYWVQWLGDTGRNNTQNTTDPSFMVGGLDPASSYEFSVWVEKDGNVSNKATLNVSTGESILSSF